MFMACPFLSRGVWLERREKEFHRETVFYEDSENKSKVTRVA